ncbi:TMEM56 [Branchiostoma lanceolatum]|uniref:TMEM56 protein n=1 Tax=Branchiostoma lanceolatum TaxID=7740 RepID=A0A8K0F151_BRALA|nr:TMEM56 [Branchiostoma lanceolatum]
MEALRIVEYYTGAVVWLVVYGIVFKYISPWLSFRLSKTYRQLTLGQRLDWDSRITSTLNSLITGPISVYLILSDNELGENPIWGHSRPALHLLAVMVGYTLTDLLNFLYYYSYWKYMGALEYAGYIAHHVGVLVAYIMCCLTFGNLTYFAVFRLTCENSTLFVNTKWLLDTKGFSKSSKPYVVNSLALALSFFVFRIATIPPYWYMVYTVYGTAQYNRLLVLNKYIWIVTCLVLDVLNINWFSRIVRGAKRILQKSKQAHSE